MKPVFYALTILAVFIVISFLILSFRIYPTAKIDEKYIWAREYYGRVSGYEHYRNAIGDLSDEKEARRGILMSLVADTITEGELISRGVSPREAESRVENILSDKGEELAKAASNLYGWNVEEFKKFALFPQAREDLLAELLQKNGIDFNDWLSKKLANAEIKIYFLSYRWEDGNLVNK